MKPVLLSTQRRYFGVDAMLLRAAASRVLLRLEGLPPERATVALDALSHDFQLDRGASHALVAQLVQGGLLQRTGGDGEHFAVTGKFRAIANAEILGPLPRLRAQMLLQHIGDVAEHFNRSATSNKYELELVAVYGDYMSGDGALADLEIAATGRHRTPAQRPSAGRATLATEGTDRIRELFEQLSPHLRVALCRKREEIPRPFRVVFKAES